MMPANAGEIGHPRIEIWWATLGAGVVVVACVVILLTLLSAFVRDIRERLAAAASASREAAAHVASGDLIDEAASLITHLAGELERHVAVVSAAVSEEG